MRNENGLMVKVLYSFADLMVKCKDELLEMGYPKFTMEDVSGLSQSTPCIWLWCDLITRRLPILQFVDTVSRTYERAVNQVVDVCIPVFLVQFNDNLMRAMEQPSEETLLGIFQDQGQSDFIVVWLRFLTVLQLRKEPDFYENFIDTYPNIVDFCRAEVEPFGCVFLQSRSLANRLDKIVLPSGALLP